MTDEKPKSEPGGWELMRAFERVEKRLDSFGREFVSVIVHNLLVERVKEVEADAALAKVEATTAIDKAKAEAAAQIAAIRTELDNAKKTRAQTWTAIGLLFVGGIVTIALGVFRQGLGLP